MTIITNVGKDFYCSQKFWWLSVNLEKLETLSCCAATPTKINFNHLKTGELFNSPVLMNERQDMLNNIPVSSCSATCWKAEANSLTSRRLSMNSSQRTHTNINAVPETLHVIVGTDCNMSCLYCCKTYSSSWAKDINDNGPYAVKTSDDRYELSVQDRVVMKLSQKDIGNGQFNKTLINELELIYQQSNLKEVVITGGEPFLYLGLEELVSNLVDKNIPVRIWSGLGVNPTRFKKEIEKISKFSNVEIVISAEATGKLYELLRYGNTWINFEKNIKILEQLSVKHSFYCTVTNITLFGIEDFFSYIGSKEAEYGPCTDPAFLSVNILDVDSKQRIFDRLAGYPAQLSKLLSNDLLLDAPLEEQNKLKTYLSEFIKRRNLDLSFLPESFKTWTL